MDKSELDNFSNYDLASLFVDSEHDPENKQSPLDRTSVVVESPMLLGSKQLEPPQVIHPPQNNLPQLPLLLDPSVDYVDNEKREVADLDIENNDEDEKEFCVPLTKNAVKWVFVTWPQCDTCKDPNYTPSRHAQMILANMTNDPRIKVKNYIICNEKHKDGEPHHHAVFELMEKKRLKNNDFNYCWKPGHIEQCRDHLKAIMYCCKEGDYITTFNIEEIKKKLPKSKENKKYYKYSTGKKIRKEKEKENLMFLKYNLSGLAEKGVISLNRLPVLQKAKNIVEMNKVVHWNQLRKCFWIMGDPGSGKSYVVRKYFEDQVFNKDHSKWWDNFNHEEVVLIEDLDPTDVADPNWSVSNSLKIWADNYSFNAQVKGGMIKPDYKILIVTSNYSIEFLFDYEKNRELCEAISRRFEIVSFHKDEESQTLYNIKEQEFLIKRWDFLGFGGVVKRAREREQKEKEELQKLIEEIDKEEGESI